MKREQIEEIQKAMEIIESKISNKIQRRKAYEMIEKYSD